MENMMVQTGICMLNRTKSKISKEKRSHIMSMIGSKNTKIELKLRSELWREGLRFKIHYDLPGKPDIVFLTKRLAIFVDGDFWHGYDFKNLKPKLKNDFWLNKITKNMQRDEAVTSTLTENGWKVLRFWEHDINNNLDNCVNKIRGEL
jgi:DNA mismatch endonuclease, patch repair protein